MDGMTINHIVSIDHGSYMYIQYYQKLYMSKKCLLCLLVKIYWLKYLKTTIVHG